MSIFRGLSAFPITPADEHGRIDTDALGVLVQRLVDARVDSIGLLGSTGTYPFFTRAERRRAIDAMVVGIGGKMPILAGTGALRTDEAVLLARDACEAGADALLLAPVSYTPLTDREVLTHFRTVAGVSAVPICIYNNPGTTHFTFGAELIGRLSEIPNVVAVKNPAPAAHDIVRHLGELRAKVPASFSLGYSKDWDAAETLIAGADAWYSVLAGLFPQPCLEIVRAVRSGDHGQARRLDARLQPLWDLFTELSSLRVVYAAVNALGLSRVDPPRPILALVQADQRRVAQLLESLELR